MAKKLLININMFDRYQPIYYIEDNKPIRTTTVLMDELVNYILYNDQWNTGIEEIEIDGNKNFIQKIGQDFINEWQNKFSNNSNVRIVLNGEVFN